MEGQLLSSREDVELRLTERELACLRWVVAGKTNPEIADILHIAEGTVGQHLKKASTKLQALNRAHLCVRAVVLGLVVPE